VAPVVSGVEPIALGGPGHAGSLAAFATAAGGGARHNGGNKT